MRARQLEALLVRAALLSGQPALAAWERARQEPEHVDRAPYRLLPQLYRNLHELGIDDSSMKRLKGVYRYSWAANQTILAESRTALRELATWGVETIVLGGVVLSELYYRDPASRPVERLDLLVRAADVYRAESVLRPAGWRSPHSVHLERLMRVGNSVSLTHPDAHPIRLHWSPFWEPVPEDEVWRRTQMVHLDDAAARTLDPTAELMRACTGGLAAAPARACWIPDAVTVVRAAAERVDWDRLAEDAARWSMTARLAGALHEVRSHFAPAVPGPVLARLALGPRSIHERAAHAIGSRALRGSRHVYHWHRHRTLRAQSPELAGSFASYWRDSLVAQGSTTVPA